MKGRRIELAVLFFTAVAAIGAIGIWIYPDVDPFGKREGRLAAPTPPEDGFNPPGNDCATPLSFPNFGQYEALIQQVDYTIKTKKVTPRRPFIACAMPSIHVTFTKDHFDPVTGRFRARFEPRAVPGKEWGTVEVSIFEPAWVGTTYIGTVTVHYNNGKTVQIENVEVDVLGKDPISDPAGV